MLKIEVRENLIMFNGNKLTQTVDQWLKALKKESLSQYLLLNEMLENGIAEAQQNTIVLENNNFYCIMSTLDEMNGILKILNLPPVYSNHIRVEIDNDIHDSKAKLSVRFSKGIVDGIPNSVQPLKRHGILLVEPTSNRQMATLTLEQYQVICQTEIYNARPRSDRNRKSNLREIARIQRAVGSVENASISLEGKISKQEIIEPRIMGIRLVQGVGGGIGVQPTIKHEETDSEDRKRHIDHINLEWGKVFENRTAVDDDYTIPVADDHGRIRILTTEDQKKGLRIIKERLSRFDSDEALSEFLESPVDMFRKEGIDFGEFDPTPEGDFWDRVKGIGIYKPKFHAFISPINSEWIPGILVEGSDKKKIQLGTSAQVEKLRGAILLAEQSGAQHIHFEEQNIPISEAKDFLEIATKQNEEPKKPIEKVVTGKKILIIKENLEELDFAQDSSLKSINHRLEQIPCLRSEISLQPHQEEGVAWLQTLYLQKSPGALIADDMGLGKTLQVLSFMEWYSSRFSGKPILLVAPVSLLENWQNEYQKFFNDAIRGMTVINLHGEIKRNRDGTTQSLSWLESKGDSTILALINYETLKRHQVELGKIHWGVVALDEAQKIKTPGTLVTNAAKAMNGDFKIAMTGTPVENTYHDLWSIMDYCVPGLLGSAKSFAQTYGSKSSRAFEDLVKMGEPLRKEIGVYLKRRTKSDIADILPRKYLSSQEQDIPKFNQLVRKGDFPNLQRQMPEVQRSHYVSTVKSQLSGKKGAMLKKIQQLRKISEHPLLDSEDLFLQSTKTTVSSSARMISLIDVLGIIEKRKEKVIVFAEFRITQHLIARIVEKQFNKHAAVINGDTPTDSRRSRITRQQTVEQFNNAIGFQVIVMSPLAAGTGLNVTGANHVIHFSRHWNPAKEDQATDRAYRIGQTKDVYVYYPMAVDHEFDTFDVIIDRLLSNKRQLSEASLYPSIAAEVKPAELFDEIVGAAS